MLLEELVDSKIYKRLCSQIKAGKAATAYIFTGEELEKKKALATAFAQALNCERSSFDPACECSICERIRTNQFLDVKWYGQDEDAVSVKIGEVRDLINWLYLKPMEGKTKAFIINGAERLTSEAQNALLKSLEEPPPGNVIILLVPQAQNLFDTIVSRSVEIKTTAFSTKEIKKILIEKKAEPAEADFLMRQSSGNLSKALAGLDLGLYQKRKEWVPALFRNPINFLEQFHSAKRAEILEVFDFLIECARDLMLVASHAPNIIHAEQIILLDPVAQRNNVHQLSELFNSLITLRKSVDENANTKLVLTQAEILLSKTL